ncbi:putative quinol monooxygenase [Luteococcus sp.]|uniref:putative quinol monooxygenase n=1 Tax=Luteococcus sp. TaxID=1969402 RepID=UPI00373691B0
MIRVLHELPTLDDPELLLAELAQVRDLDGCDSAELYRSLAAGEDSHALTMTWRDEDSHDAFWQQVLGGEFPELWRLVATGDSVEGATEFYRCERFALVDGAWRPEGAGERRAISWPARGEVRVIIQNAVQATEAMYDKIRDEIAETRRELGCTSYAWHENVELPGHLLLLEVWSGQMTYDQHWALRLATADFLGDNLRTPAEPQRGPVAREFYRRQRFAHHYDRWMPCDAAQVATTIVWPAS